MVARALPVATGTEQPRNMTDRAPGCRRSGRRHGYRGNGRHGSGSAVDRWLPKCGERAACYHGPLVP